MFWGVGALLAGTSYQAFSYEIKCVGYEFCVWTSWWEILYMVFSVASVNSMVAALAYSSADGKLRKKMIVYAIINLGVYLLVSIIGVSVPVKFLISFELMLVFLAPSILFLFILNLVRSRKQKSSLDLVLMGIWLWLGFTVGAYYAYYLLGYTEILWEQGVWFSDNDVLHIGLIIWMLSIAIGLGKKVLDTNNNIQPG